MSDTVVDMHKYYDFRRALKNMYLNDTKGIGDLACKVLEIRDQNRQVNSINLAIQEGTITVELNDKISDKKRKEVISKINNSIGRFIVDNKETLSNIDEETFDIIMNHGSGFCDVYNVGNEIIFGLF